MRNEVESASGGEKKIEEGSFWSKNKLGIILVIIGLIAIAAIVTVVIYRSKPKTITPAVTTPVNPLAQFDGSYSGTSNANKGITAANVNILNGTITGTANYTGAYSIKIVLTVTGTVDANGNVSGNLSGTGTSGGQSATVIGTYTGAISGTTINVNYSGSGGGESASGTIVLTKK
ncbi:MAG: hypothetical protein NTY30_01840 [Candidatus Berkelbacteria bacterium]|nr:hypothetical protein [Candidatus Berkelbacteria bacterium]